MGPVAARPSSTGAAGVGRFSRCLIRHKLPRISARHAGRAGAEAGLERQPRSRPPRQGAAGPVPPILLWNVAHDWAPILLFRWCQLQCVSKDATRIDLAAVLRCERATALAEVIPSAAEHIALIMMHVFVSVALGQVYAVATHGLFGAEMRLALRCGEGASDPDGSAVAVPATGFDRLARRRPGASTASAMKKGGCGIWQPGTPAKETCWLCGDSSRRK